MSREATREIFISGKKISVFDDVFSADEVKKNFALFGHAGFSFLHASRQDTSATREWAATFSVDDFRKHRLHSAFLDLASAYSSRVNLQCYDVFCNASSFGDMSFIHNDSTNASDISLLYYVNPIWNAEWGGETIFFDQDDDAVCAVSARPGRIIVFDGSIKHRAGLPTRVCTEVRLSLSVRFERAL